MKAKLLRVANIALFIAGCVLVGTGLLLEVRLEGTGTVLGWSFEEWGGLHFMVALTCVALTVVHVVLNWSWVAGLFARRQAIAVAVTLLAAVGIIGGMLLLPK